MSFRHERAGGTGVGPGSDAPGRAGPPVRGASGGARAPHAASCLGQGRRRAAPRIWAFVNEDTTHGSSAWRPRVQYTGRRPRTDRTRPCAGPLSRSLAPGSATQRDEEPPAPTRVCLRLPATHRTQKQSPHPDFKGPLLQEHGRGGRCTHFPRPSRQMATSPTAKTSRIHCCEATVLASRAPAGAPWGTRARPLPAAGAPGLPGSRPPAPTSQRVHVLPPAPTWTTQAQPPPKALAWWRLRPTAQRSRAVTSTFGGRERLAACTQDEVGFAQVSELFPPDPRIQGSHHLLPQPTPSPRSTCRLAPQGRSGTEGV